VNARALVKVCVSVLLVHFTILCLLGALSVSTYLEMGPGIGRLL